MGMLDRRATQVEIGKGDYDLIDRATFGGCRLVGMRLPFRAMAIDGTAIRLVNCDPEASEHIDITRLVGHASSSRELLSSRLTLQLMRGPRTFRFLRPGQAADVRDRVNEALEQNVRSSLAESLGTFAALAEERYPRTSDTFRIHSCIVTCHIATTIADLLACPRKSGPF